MQQIQRGGIFFKLLINGMAVIIALSLLWFCTIAYFLYKSDKEEALSTISQEILQNFVEARVKEKSFKIRNLYEKSFYETGTSEELKKENYYMSKAMEGIARLKEIGNKDHRELVAEIEHDIQEYGKVFEQCVGFYKTLGFDEWGIAGELQTSMDKLKTLAEGAQNQALLQKYTDVARYQAEFYMQRDADFLNVVRQSLEDLKNAAMPLPEASRVAILATVEQYGTQLNRYAELKNSIGWTEDRGLRHQLKSLSDDLEPKVRKLAEEGKAANEKAKARLLEVNLIIALVGLCLGVLLFYLVSRKLAAPLKSITAVAERLSQGDLRQEVEISQSAREIFILSSALKNMLGNLKKQFGELKEGANVLGATTAEITATVSQVASSTAETATAVTQTMTTAEELRQTSELNAQKAKYVSENANESSNMSNTGRKATEQILGAMNNIKGQMEGIAESVISLSEQSKTIGEIISAVDDLAEQSNILSVNAAIEAARAGEQGRGFAIVAQEIRSLAEQSKEATKRVRVILTGIQKATSNTVLAMEQGSKAVDQAAQQADEVNKSIQSLANKINVVDQAAVQILSSSKQQLVGVEQVVAAIENIREATEQNAKSMDQLEEAAFSLEKMGSSIVEMVGWYRV